MSGKNEQLIGLRKRPAADGAAGAPGVDAGEPGLVLLATATATASTSVDFTSFIDSTYDEYIVSFINVIPATDGVTFLMRTSTDTGSTFDSGASDYHYAYDPIRNAGTPLNSSASTAISLVLSVGSGSAEGLSGSLTLFGPSNTAAHTRIIGQFSYFSSSSSNNQGFVPHGARAAITDVDAIRFLMSSGNITSGEFKLYGVTKA